MTDKEIGFNRHVFLPWLDDAAILSIEMDDPVEIRKRLDAILASEVNGVVTRRKAIDILLNTWFKTKKTIPGQWQIASNCFQTIPANERIWLHYGFTIVAYPFVRDCLQIIGQFNRSDSTFTKIMVRDRLIAQRGQLGSLERSLRYVLASLRQWGVVFETDKKHVYRANDQVLSTRQPTLESWFLACALHAHPAEEIPFVDLLRLPELFPFHFSITVDTLRADPRFTIHRQASGWEMVRLTK